jgi:hypothetical protein
VEFPAVLKRELALRAAELPLQQALSTASAVADEPITVALLTAQADGALLRVKVGIFFSGIVPGCSCADDPTPLEPQPEYCELRLEIDRNSAETVVRLDG